MSRRIPAARSASPAARSTASCGLRRASAISRISRRRSISTTAMRLPRREVMIIATGGQGEPRAALARIAFDQHKLKLDAGDLVVFSSKQIPGNEIAIGRIQNELAAQGHRDDHRPPGAGPRLRPSRPARARRDVRLDPARDHRPGPWRDAPHGRAGPLRPRAAAFRTASSRRMATSSGSRPNGPEKLGEERVGRLVLDGDVILPADGATMNERRRLAARRPDLGRGRARRRRPARRATSRSRCRAFRSRRIARPSSTRPARPPPTRSRKGARQTRTSCARRSGSPSAAAPPNGPARSRSSSVLIVRV